jgi:hypothetical protein
MNVLAKFGGEEKLNHDACWNELINLRLENEKIKRKLEELEKKLNGTQK